MWKLMVKKLDWNLQINGKNLNLKIQSECIGCEPVEEFNGNLVFAKQLFISKDEITFYPNEINNSTKKIRIKTQTCDSEKTNKFNFIGGNAKIKFAKVSCNDSNLNDVILDYGKENECDYILGADGSGSLMYAKDSDDITKDVLVYINNKYKGVKWKK